MRELSEVFREYPDVYQNMVMLTVQNETDYFASSEGSRIVAPHMLARLVAVAVTRADDGMDLFRAQTFEAETVDGLPTQAELEAAMRELGKSLEALRKAPVTEPFDGPAILSGRAAAVFFHEVLGHRLEGQRQRGDEEGQTFTKDIGKEVLPDFLSVADDPTVTNFGNTWLSGSYEYDDEGQKARARRSDRGRRAQDLPHVAPAHRQLRRLQRPRPRGNRPRAHRPPGQPDRDLDQDRARSRAAQAADRRSQKAGQALRPLL